MARENLDEIFETVRVGSIYFTDDRGIRIGRSIFPDATYSNGTIGDYSANSSTGDWSANLSIGLSTSIFEEDTPQSEELDRFLSEFKINNK